MTATITDDIPGCAVCNPDDYRSRRWGWMLNSGGAVPIWGLPVSSRGNAKSDHDKL